MVSILKKKKITAISGKGVRRVKIDITNANREGYGKIAAQSCEERKKRIYPLATAT